MCFAVSQNQQVIRYVNENPEIYGVNHATSDFSSFQNNYFASAFNFPQLPVITPRSLELLHWGLIPFWTKGEEDMSKIRMMTMNARSETLFDKPSFSESAKAKRCLLPVNGFFEWQEVNKQKYPYYIFPKSLPLFYLGCIYDSWVNKETGEIINSFGMVNTPANPMMREIHNSGRNRNRMPLIIDESDAKAWLDSTLERSEIEQLMSPFNERKMDAFTISKDANYSRKNRNYPEMLNRVDYPEKNLSSGLLFAD